MAASTHAYELTLPNFLALDEAARHLIQVQLSRALRFRRFRLLSFVEPVSPGAFEQVRRKRLPHLKEEWRRRYIEEEARSVRLSLDADRAWSLRHFLVVWGQPVMALTEYLTPAVPPDPLVGESKYSAGPDCLLPTRPGALFAKTLAVYDYRPGQWTFTDPWLNLISGADGPMAVAVDFERIPEGELRLARQNLKALAQAQADDEDTQRQAAAARAALVSTDAVLYRTRIGIVLRDASERVLLARAHRLQQAFDGTLGVSLLAGRQAPVLQLFDDAPTLRQMPYGPRTVMGEAVPVMVSGLAGVRNDPYPWGIYLGFNWGANGQNLGPVYFMGWTESNRAYHVGFLGTTGSGKSVSMMAQAAREHAAHGVPIVLIEPMGNARKLARLLGPEGFNAPDLRYYQLGWNNIQINPLDYAGENRAEQNEQVVTLLQVMLNRALDNIEQGLVGKALDEVYAGCTEEDLLDPERTPRLELLCDALHGLKATAYKGELADHLAHELDGLYVSGGKGDIFNRPTNLNLKFEGADLFDVQAVAGQGAEAERMQTLLYFCMFTALIRRARLDKQAGKVRRRILMIDEYYALSRNPFLANRLAALVKTARNLHLALWLAEQNLATFAGTEVGKAGDLTAHYMLTNVPFWYIFKQEPAEANLAHANFGHRLPRGYADRLPSAPQGAGFALLEKQTVPVNFNLLPTEARALLARA